MAKDFYDVLGVDSEASGEDIKKDYRRRLNISKKAK
jgi:DnaJ-class molecular chaperone